MIEKNLHIPQIEGVEMVNAIYPSDASRTHGSVELMASLTTLFPIKFKYLPDL